MKFLLSCSVFAWLTSALSLVVPGSHPWSSLGFPTHQADQYKRSGGGCGGANSSGYNIDLFSQKVGPRPAEEIFWYTYITVGTPPQQFQLLFDTGAQHIIIPSQNCTTCGNATLFNWSVSSTFSDQPSIDTLIGFGNGALANCTVITDAVRLGGRTVLAQEFMLCYTYSEHFHELAGDGIFGLSPSATSAWYPTGNEYTTFYWGLISQGQLSSPEWGLALVKCGNHARDGILTIGGTDISLYHPNTLKAVPLSWPLSEVTQWWVLDISGVCINGVFPVPNTTNSVTLVDTGSYNVVAPDYETAKALFALISPLIKRIDSERGVWGAPCTLLDAVAKDVVFHFGSGSQVFDAVLEKKYFNMGPTPGKPGWCSAIIADPGSDYKMREPIAQRRAWIHGNKILKPYYTVWNGVSRTVSFAKLKT